LENTPGQPVEWLRRDYRHLLAEMARYRHDIPETTPFLHQAASHFLKVSRSYWGGLFHCYETPALPRTNNALEHTFGTLRCQERRATGRKVASPTTVLRGSVRLVAAIGTCHKPPAPEQLRPRSLSAWRALRQGLETRMETRRQQRRFRRDPALYLAAVEERLLSATLPV
jgi:hypothetical protein